MKKSLAIPFFLITLLSGCARKEFNENDKFYFVNTFAYVNACNSADLLSYPEYTVYLTTAKKRLTQFSYDQNELNHLISNQTEMINTLPDKYLKKHCSDFRLSQNQNLPRHQPIPYNKEQYAIYLSQPKVNQTVTTTQSSQSSVVNCKRLSSLANNEVKTFHKRCPTGWIKAD